MMAAMKPRAVSTPIEAGEMKVQIEISGVFELQR